MRIEMRKLQRKMSELNKLKIKNSLEGFNNRITTTQNRIIELKYDIQKNLGNNKKYTKLKINPR